MRPRELWILSAISGATGASLLYDASVGINCGIWTVITIAGLVVYRRPNAVTLRAIAPHIGAAIVLALGIAVTANDLLIVPAIICVMVLLALVVMIAPVRTGPADYGPLDILGAPILALRNTIASLLHAITDALSAIESPRNRSSLRSVLVAAPVVIVLALLFAAADPILASARDAIVDALTEGSAVPRLIFGIVVTLFVAGAYLASRETVTRLAPPIAPPARTGHLTETALADRRAVLIGAAAVSWLFVLLQVSYLFGAPPFVAGSGVTYAEYTHRGFGELTLAATGVALLIVAVHRRASVDEATGIRRRLMWPGLGLIAAVGCILISAFHRVSLYEGAYGFTAARVDVQAYLLLVGVVLAILAWEVTREFDVRALSRKALFAALTALACMTFWNRDAWVARANLDRYSVTGKLDTDYLTRDLSADAYPTLVRSLHSVGEPERTALAVGLAAEYRRIFEARPGIGVAWYEWNLRRERARHLPVVADTLSHTVQIGPPAL